MFRVSGEVLCVVLLVSTARTVFSATLTAADHPLSDVICPDGGVCPDGNTCCMLASGSYGCCPLSGAVCCPDKEHCCPSGDTCTAAGCQPTSVQSFIDKLRVQPSGIKQQASRQEEGSNVNLAREGELAANGDVVHCPGGQSFCPDGMTCCLLPTHQWVCCPYPLGTCCRDGYHCCPHGFRCDATSTHCSRDGQTSGAANFLMRLSALRQKKEKL